MLVPAIWLPEPAVRATSISSTPGPLLPEV